MINDELLTPQEAADYLGCKPGTLAFWRSNGRHPDLRFTRLGNRSIRYRKSDLDAWLRKRSSAPEPERRLSGSQMAAAEALQAIADHLKIPMSVNG